MVFSLHTLLTMHGHRNLKNVTLFVNSMYYFYPKDKWAKPGNLQTKKKIIIWRISCSTRHKIFIIFIYLFIFLALALLQWVKPRLIKSHQSLVKTYTAYGLDYICHVCQLHEADAGIYVVTHMSQNILVKETVQTVTKSCWYLSATSISTIPLGGITQSRKYYVN